jgi:hypothetical protein
MLLCDWSGQFGRMNDRSTHVLYILITFRVHVHVAFRLAVVNDVSLITKFEFERETRITDPSDTIHHIVHVYIFTPHTLPIQIFWKIY